MPAMINADLLREQLVNRIQRLHREVQQASGFDGLITAGAMRALAEMLHALDAATQQPTTNTQDRGQQRMTTKTLYLLVADGGDGSYSISYTLDPEVIRLREAAYDRDEYEHGDPGVDGDGFHYDTIQVPADATYESLGISKWHVLSAPEVVAE